LESSSTINGSPTLVSSWFGGAKLTLEEEAEAVAQLIEEHGERLLDAFTVIKQQGKPRIRKRTS